MSSRPRCAAEKKTLACRCTRYAREHTHARQKAACTVPGWAIGRLYTFQLLTITCLRDRMVVRRRFHNLQPVRNFGRGSAIRSRLPIIIRSPSVSQIIVYSLFITVACK